MKNFKLTLGQLILVLFFGTSHYSAQAQCANASNIYTFVHNGVSYEVVKQNETWTNAVACAVSRGGMLAEINDAAEQTAIFNAVSNSAGINLNSTTAPDGGGGAYVWIGGNDLATEGTWIWDGNNDGNGAQFWQGNYTGNPVGGLYNNWGNEPDDYLGQDALAMSLNGWPFGTAGQWNDVDHTNTLFYVIEYTTNLCNNTSSFNATACGSYTSPSGNYTWTTSGTYMDTIPNAAGCDSAMTITLTIDSVSDITTTTAAETITANNTNATYQWLDCDNGYAVIAGETAQSFTATANGNYAVELTENGCVDTSACVAINTVGLLENTFGEGFSLYPNPTQGDFSIELGEVYSSVEVRMTDLTGQLIRSEEYQSTDLVNVIFDEPKGMYILMIRADDHMAVLKLIKE